MKKKVSLKLNQLILILALTSIAFLYNNCVSQKPLEIIQPQKIIGTILHPNQGPRQVHIDNNLVQNNDVINVNHNEKLLLILNKFNEKTLFCFKEFKSSQPCQYSPLIDQMSFWKFNKKEKIWSLNATPNEFLPQKGLYTLSFKSQNQSKPFNLNLFTKESFRFLINGTIVKETPLIFNLNQDDLVLKLLYSSPNSSFCINKDCYKLKQLVQNWSYNKEKQLWVGFYPKKTFTKGEYVFSIKDTKHSIKRSTKVIIN